MSTPFEPVQPIEVVETTPVLTNAFLPVLILALTLLAWFSFQVVQLRIERDAMRDAISKQDKPVEDSKKMREAFEAVARGTQQLADSGNPNARLIVDELKKRGVTINPNQTPSPPPPPSK